MPAAVDSVFDIAFWFTDTAENHGEYLQPQKLQRLLYMAQAYYSVAYGGKKLMPAVFVADELGPIEPNVYRAFAKGRPDIDSELFIPHEVEMFLDSIWRRFGAHSAERLGAMTMDTKAYKHALKTAPKTEITLQAMRQSFTKDRAAPGIEQVIRPKVMRSQTGKPVAVKTWKPQSATAETETPQKPAKSTPVQHQFAAAKASPPITSDAPTKTVDKILEDSPWPAPPKRLGGRPWPPAGKRAVKD